MPRRAYDCAECGRRVTGSAEASPVHPELCRACGARQQATELNDRVRRLLEVGTPREVRDVTEAIEGLLDD